MQHYVMLAVQEITGRWIPHETFDQVIVSDVVTMLAPKVTRTPLLSGQDVGVDLLVYGLSLDS